MIEQAALRHDSKLLEYAIIICMHFGAEEQCAKIIRPLVRANWHRSHEDSVTILGRAPSPDSISTLRYAAEFVPDYLEYDDGRAMARKAIHALRRIPGNEAEAAIVSLLDSDSETVRSIAATQLAKRRAERQT